MVATVDATGIETRREYDAIGRLVEYQYGDRPAATRTVVYGPGTAYREELRDPRDPVNRITQYEFDDLGRMVKTTDAALGETLVAYNLLGSPQTVTDPLGKPTVFTFDTLGRTSSVTPSYGGPEVLTYDQTGNVIRRRKPNLCELEHDYDAMGRLVARRTEANNSSCADGPIDDQFGYDARGLLVAAQSPAVGLIREYDALGRMLREIDTRFGTGVGYAYDSASRLASKVYPDGSAVHYAYDGAGRTVGISDPFGDTTRFVYDAAGRRVQKLGTKGLRTEYAYAPGTGWLTGVTSYTETGGVAAAFTYPAHDDVGNRLAMTETSGGATSYTYDALDRLSTLDPPDEAIYPANGALTEFAYDAAGNRTDFGPKSGGSFASPHMTYTYNAATKRLLNIKKDGAIVETFSGYDGNGNPATWTPQAPNNTARSLKYDGLGRLVSISGGFTASYVYDPFGRRIEKTEENITTRYQYDGLDVVAEYSASQLEATYVFGPGIDEVLKLKRGTVLAAYHSDGLGSVVSVTDASSGGSLKTYRYDAFGKPIAQTGTLANAYTYTGREQDASGLYYYRARYYLPSAGRFLTPDPIGLAGGINAYTYVSSNPVNYTDPFGLMAGRPMAPAAPDEAPAFQAMTDPSSAELAKRIGFLGYAAVAGIGQAFVDELRRDVVLQGLAWVDRNYGDEIDMITFNVSHMCAGWRGACLLPGRVPAAATWLTAARGSQNFLSVERSVVAEVQSIVNGPNFARLQDAFRSGVFSEFKMGGRTVLVEPGHPYSGLSLFGENGYVLGREAFSSSDELIKTLLHETYRLETSAVRSRGSVVAGPETQATYDFVERVFEEYFKR